MKEISAVDSNINSFGYLQHSFQKGLNMPDQYKNLVNRNELATILGMSKGLFNKMVAAGRIPAPTHVFSKKTVLWDLKKTLNNIEEMSNDWSVK